MKNIYFKEPLEQQYIRLYTHLANLFFEESKVVIDPQGDFLFSITLEENEGKFIANGCLIVEGQQYQHVIQEPIEEVWLSAQHQQKRIQSRVFLELLEQQTGMVQQWGILTGIRPMKLYHKLLQKMQDKNLVHEHLAKKYRISTSKIELLSVIEQVQKAAIPDLYDLKEEVSIYIGIPFCPTKCAYCTFPAYAIHRKSGKVETFLEALHYEIEQVGAWLKEHHKKITTIYFGGGTPTSIEAEEMAALYTAVQEAFPDVEAIREVTVEAGRPDTITVEKLNVLNTFNIDRISVNPQSYTNETLKAIGRHHTVEETIEKYWLAREHGMHNINMDLIIGLPNEGLSHFEHSLEETAKMQPESVTMHTLSFKRASHMSQNKEKYKVADRSTTEQMMRMGERWAEENDYAPYYLYRQKNILGNLENVGYSKKNEESLYNIIIMEEAQTIIGLGSGASSKFITKDGKIKQYLNPKEPVAYTLSIQKSIDEKIDHLNELLNL